MDPIATALMTAGWATIIPVCAPNHITIAIINANLKSGPVDGTRTRTSTLATSLANR